MVLSKPREESEDDSSDDSSSDSSSDEEIAGMKLVLLPERLYRFGEEDGFVTNWLQYL